MLKLLRRWFGGSGDDWDGVADWAESRGHRFARSRDGSGFVVEAAAGDVAWRMEWGAPQRRYIGGPELRLRADLGVETDLQMLLATRALMDLLEHQVFEGFTESNKTRMDDETPEEMRWLVLYPKLPRAEMPALRERFGALSNLPRAALLWLDPALTQQLVASSSWLAQDQPLALVVQRGRLTLRCRQTQPTLAALRGAVGLFSAAVLAARQVAAEAQRGAIASGRPSTWGPAPPTPASGETPPG